MKIWSQHSCILNSALLIPADWSSFQFDCFSTFCSNWVIHLRKSVFFIRIFVIFDYGGTGGSKKFRFSLAMLFQESKMEQTAEHRSTPSPRSALYNWYFLKGEQFENMFNPRVLILLYRAEQIIGRIYVELYVIINILKNMVQFHPIFSKKHQLLIQRNTFLTNSI